MILNKAKSGRKRWQNGRELASGTKGSTSFAYTYNADGLRTKKVVGNLVYTYYWQGSQLAAMTIGNTSGTITATLKFYYDSNGIPFVLDYNGTIYFYLTNLQGDVIGLATSEGMGGYYRYDAWGQIVTMDAASTPYYNALNANPLRYRGYIYDSETGFYYLQSRYYDPAVRRFISADGYVSTGTGFIGYNMYAYCNNNPVNNYDSTGELASAIVGGFFGAIFGAVAASFSGDSILAGALTGATSGILCGLICDSAANYIVTGGKSIVRTLSLATIGCATASGLTNLANQYLNYRIDKNNAENIGQDFESFKEYLNVGSVVTSAVVSGVFGLISIGVGCVVGNSFAGSELSLWDKIAQTTGNILIGTPITMLGIVIDWAIQKILE